MEPFSLLPFLQTLIRNLPSPVQPTAEPCETKEIQSQTPVEPPANPPTENPCLAFFAMHDERVKRTKK